MPRCPPKATIRNLPSGTETLRPVVVRSSVRQPVSGAEHMSCSRRASFMSCPPPTMLRTDMVGGALTLPSRAMSACEGRSLRVFGSADRPLSSTSTSALSNAP